ncbi:hypothetical protein [Clostridium sp.]
MSASQQKALNNLSTSQQTAVATGFSTAVLALTGVALIGIYL